MFSNTNKLIIALLLTLLNVNDAINAANHAVILQYHHISSTTPAATSLSTEKFNAHLQALQAGGFKIMALPELLKKIQNRIEIEDKTVAITFDDAYQSVYEVAYPLLKQRGWPFTVFVAPDAIDKKQHHVMNWHQIRELADSGVTIANHSYSHQHLIRRLPKENELNWRKRVLADIEKAEQIIFKQTAQSHHLLAWPYGEYADPLSEDLKQAGYVAVAQHSGVIHHQSNFQALPRFSFNQAYADVDDFIVKASSLALVVTKVVPQQVVVNDANFSQLKLWFSHKTKNINQLSCFASDQGKVSTKIIGFYSEVRLNSALNPGRSRLNCTIPAGNGRFYWYSKLIIRKQSDGRWYNES